MSEEKHAGESAAGWGSASSSRSSLGSAGFQMEVEQLGEDGSITTLPQNIVNNTLNVIAKPGAQFQVSVSQPFSPASSREYVVSLRVDGVAVENFVLPGGGRVVFQGYPAHHGCARTYKSFKFTVAQNVKHECEEEEEEEKSSAASASSASSSSRVDLDAEVGLIVAEVREWIGSKVRLPRGAGPQVTARGDTCNDEDAQPLMLHDKKIPIVAASGDRVKGPTQRLEAVGAFGALLQKMEIRFNCLGQEITTSKHKAVEENWGVKTEQTTHMEEDDDDD